ncbi:MAG TPA: DMT family transporter [Candidatus Acidoferrales bacterium]|nr:DMT family transporter [Candidatus Acidoferrales bacterium]
MRRSLKADMALALCTVLWGATFVVVKGALDSASVFVFMALRFVLATLLMAAIYRRALRRLTRAEVWAGAQIGFFMFTGYAFQTRGLIHTTPSKAAFITGSGVVVVPVLMALFWGRRIHRSVWAGALAALLGLYYLTVPPAGLARLNGGDVLVAVCAVMFALHIIFVGRYSPHHSVGALSFLQVATTAALTLVALPAFGALGWERPRLEWNAALVSAVLVTAVLATAVAFSVQVWSQQYTTPTHTAILFSLEPVFAAITSYLVVRERLGRRALLGAGLILAGILLAELKGPTRAAAESPGPAVQSPEPGS